MTSKPKGLGHYYIFHVICYDKKGKRVWSDWANFPFHHDPKYFSKIKDKKHGINSCVVLQAIARITYIDADIMVE